MIPAQPGGGVGPPAGGGRARRRGLRLGLAIGAGVLALLCLGGLGVFISLYDEATEIKRTAPDAVVDSFLRAYLVNRNEQEAALYRCEAGGEFSQLEALKSDIVSREKQFSISINVSWTSLTVTEMPGRATVTTDIIRTISDGSERTSDRWVFPVVAEDGWRVCGGSAVP